MLGLLQKMMYDVMHIESPQKGKSLRCMIIDTLKFLLDLFLQDMKELAETEVSLYL